MALSLVFAAIVLWVAAFHLRKDSYDPDDPNSIGYQIAVESNTAMETATREKYPNAEIVYVSSPVEGFMLVKSGGADAFAADSNVARHALKEKFPDLMIYGEPYGEISNMVVGISRKSSIDHAEELINAYLKEVHEDGTLEDMYRRWIIEGDYDSYQEVHAEEPDRVIRIITTGLTEPYSFVRGEEIIGFDVELMKQFCLWANAELELIMTDWEGAFSLINSDKADYLISNLYSLDGSRETMLFSDPYLTIQTVLVQKNDQYISADTHMSLSDIRYRFVHNFLEEDRWYVILVGIRSTIEITLYSMMLGTLLGMILCGMKFVHNKWVSSAIDGMTSFLSAVPSIVVLMFFYYVLFGGKHKMWIAVLSFALCFGTSISDAMKVSIDSVDRSQLIAAEILGLDRLRIFTKILLPQAMEQFILAYKSAMVSLLLGTSVCGYVTIIDLTYASQLIRSRTYDALFSLILIAFFYYVLSCLMNAVVDWCYNRVYRNHQPLPQVDRDTAWKTGHNTLKDQEEVQSRKDNGPKEKSIVKLSHLKKKFSDSEPLSDVSLEIQKGEVVSLIGPSGSGKSTLFNCLYGLKKPTSGEIRLFDIDFLNCSEEEQKLLRHRIGVVMQGNYLFHHLTIIENLVIAPVYVLGKSWQMAYEEGMRILDTVGLVEKAWNYPKDLSGGQKQRVQIARALAMEPQLLILDEPTVYLEQLMVREVEVVVHALKENGMTMLIATHDLQFAEEVSSRILFLDQGQIMEEGSAEDILHHPKTERCRQFLSSENTFACAVKDGFDYPGTIAGMENYAQQWEMERRQSIKLEQLLDDLCMTLLLASGQYKVIRYSVYWNPDRKQCEVSFQYEGPGWNPLQDEDDLAVMIVLSRLLWWDYHYDGGMNEIKMKF